MGMQADARKGLIGPDPKESRRTWKPLKQDERLAIKRHVVLVMYQAPS